MQIETVIVDDRHPCIGSMLSGNYKDKGYRFYDSGFFATVYRKDDRVVKLATGDDHGYRGWVETIMALGDENPYLPRIYSATRYQWNNESRNYAGSDGRAGYSGDDILAVEMEYLTPINNEGMRCGRHNFGDFLSDYIIFADNQVGHLRTVKQDLIHLLRIAREQGATSRWPTPDLHIGNYMKRGHQLVITDPFS